MVVEAVAVVLFGFKAQVALVVLAVMVVEAVAVMEVIP
jgi:hypothetical protein